MDIESLIKKIHSKESFLSLEVSPSVSARIDSELIGQLANMSEVDAIVCTDSPLARFKPSSILSSLKLQQMLHKPVICTLSMRDRNSIALCGDILGANELGLRTFLTLTGDCIKHGDCADAKGVFEDNSLKLGGIIDNLNKGIALNGKPLREKVDRIYNFQVINSYANNSQSLVNKMNKKLDASNICAFFTQPVYSRQSADFLLSSLESINKHHNTDCEIIFGFFPVMSYRAALFLRDRLPGVYIPTQWVEKLEKAKEKGADEEKKVGLDISLKLFKDLRNLHNKIHFMSSNRLDLLQLFVK